MKKLLIKIYRFFNGNVSLGKRQDLDCPSYHLGSASKPRPFPLKSKSAININKIKTIKDLIEAFKND